MSRDAFGNYSLQCLYCTYTSTCWGPLRKHREEKHEDVKKASAKRHSFSHITSYPKSMLQHPSTVQTPQGGIERCIEVCTVLRENSCSWTTKSHCSNPGVEGKGGAPLLIKMILVKYGKMHDLKSSCSHSVPRTLELFSPLQALKAEEYDANQASIRIGVNWCLVEY